MLRTRPACLTAVGSLADVVVGVGIRCEVQRGTCQLAALVVAEMIRDEFSLLLCGLPLCRAAEGIVGVGAG